jgi:hypothetical protein
MVRSVAFEAFLGPKATFESHIFVWASDFYNLEARLEVQTSMTYVTKSYVHIGFSQKAMRKACPAH